MTRLPSNRRHRPLAFSSFSRNADLMASKSTKLKQLSSSKSDEKASVKSQDGEIEKRCMKGKGVLSESSSGEKSDSEEENSSEEETNGDTKPIKELKNFLFRACKEKVTVGDLRMLLNEQAHDVGLLVIKHVNDFPPELLTPLYNILFNEVAQAAKHELINANQRKGTSKSDSDEPIIYAWPEDEVFHKLSSWTFTFPLRSRPTDEMKNYKPMGLVMALEAKKVLTFQKELQSLIRES
ncbi:hypothetical protein MKX03_031623 [Papaver bracteatum]|nr:hypothetical protein MKX03_031623 [Papaver bracteatum]